MGWKIPDIKIHVPEVRLPKAPAGRAMPKPPRAARGPASGKIDGFSLTVFSSDKVPIESKHIDVIKALIASGGNRKVASEKSGINKSLVSYHAKKIRNLPAGRLEEYAAKLNTTAAEIKRVCADLSSAKGITDIEIIRALLETGGSRRAAAKKLGILHGGVSQRAAKIRSLPADLLRQYAKELQITAPKIKALCADLAVTKNITRIDVIKALLETGGNRTAAAKKLGITPTGVSRYAEKIRNLSDAELAPYAGELHITPAKIRNICADLHTTKGTTRVSAIRAFLEADGFRTKAAEKMGINLPCATQHARAIRNLSDAELAVYAKELRTTVSEIRRVCADLTAAKGITRLEVIKTLFETGGNRTLAAEKLGVHGGVISKYAKSTRKLSDAQLQKYAGELKTTVAEIRELCADLTAAKGITRTAVIKALIETEGNRAEAAVKLRVHPGLISKYAKDITRLPGEALQKYADEINGKTGVKITISEIKEVIAPRKKRKINFKLRLRVIKALLETQANRTEASKILEINTSNVSQHAKNIRHMSDWELAPYAQELGTSVAQIKKVCADFDNTKGLTHIDVIRVLLETGGSRTRAAKKLGVNQGIVSLHSQNIRDLPDSVLQKYAYKLRTGINEIRKACADLESRKGVTHIDVIKALFETSGNKASAAEKLGISAHAVINHAKNIRQLPEAGLAEYAVELGVTVERIKEVCGSPLERAKKLFKK